MANKYTEADLSAARSDIVDTISRFIQLSKSGKDYSACCPFHNETTPSFTVSNEKQFYHCFGCGAHGDAISFVMEYEGKSFHDAVERITGSLPSTDNAQSTNRTKTHTPKPSVWRSLNKAARPATIAELTHYQYGEPSHTWEYRTIDNELIGYVCRFPYTKDDGTIGKQTWPLAWCVNNDTGALEYRWLGFPVPRPLYGLQKLSTKKPVIIFEGEKTTDAGQKLFTGFNALGWPGGGNGVNNADFSALAGLDVTLWPDFDWQNDKKTGELLPELEQPGIKAMHAVYEKIKDIANSVRIVKPSRDFPDGWDVADDAPMPDFKAIEYAKNNVVSAADYFNKSEPIEEPEPDTEKDEPVRFFKILGFDRDAYYVYQYEKKQTVRMTKSDMTTNGFMEIAPLEWWMDAFPSKQGFAKDDASNWLIREAHDRGIYDPSLTRGRGAWIDDGRLIFHFGNIVSVDGKLTELPSVKSRYIYEQSTALLTMPDNALTIDEAENIFNIAGQFRWTRSASQPLLAGWIVLAPLCGMLKWRPHIWLTGGAGSGKTTIVNDYIHHLLGDVSIYAQGNSTEAGIRQTIKCDAIPVIFDESEQNNDREQSRVQNILSLIRQASSESGAKTLKGTAGGDALNFLIRSMFCLSSIQVGIKHQADYERLTILNLVPKNQNKNAADQWHTLRDQLHLLQRDRNIGARLFKRSLDMLPSILKNIELCVDICTKKFNSVREGDQIGTLLGGALALLSDETPEYEFIKSWIDTFNFDEYREHADTDESTKALTALLESRVRSNHGDMTIFSAIEKYKFNPEDCNSILSGYGMKVQNNKLYLANNSSSLNELMKNTPYAADLKGQLLRIEGAQKEPPMKFAGYASRAISLPISLIVD